MEPTGEEVAWDGAPSRSVDVAEAAEGVVDWWRRAREGGKSASKGGGEAEAAADGPESKESAPDHSTISAIILEQLAAQRAVSDAGASGESAAL